MYYYGCTWLRVHLSAINHLEYFIKYIPICNKFVIQVLGKISIISNLGHFPEYMPLICTPTNIYSVVWIEKIVSMSLKDFRM